MEVSYNVRPLQTVIRSADVHASADVSSMEWRMKDKGFGEGKDLARFAIEHSARRMLPYGRWTCSDGRQVLFNREYQPIFQWQAGVYSYADRDEWVGTEEVPIVKTEYFYDDLTSPMRYLVKHLGRSLSAADAKACKKSLFICLAKLKEFTPEEHPSVNHTYSARDL